MPATLHDVAKAAEVSVATASRALNNSRHAVNEVTRERVRRVAEELGYQPNMMAKGLRAGRSRTLGVVAYGLEYYGPSRILMGLEQQANSHGYSTLLHLLHQPESDGVDHVLQELLARQVEGIVWAIPEIGPNRVGVAGHLQAFSAPFIFVGGSASEMLAPVIQVDNVAIGRLAAEHLIAQGSRRIGIITGPLTWWEARARVQGWQEVLAEQGLDADATLVAEGDWSAWSGERGALQLLTQHPDLDAIFASNDQMALGAMHALHGLGRSIPQEVVVVGVDDTAEAEHYWPPLTTIRQGLREAGSIAARQIIHTIESPIRIGNAVGQLVILQPQLVARTSSARR